MIHRCRVVLVRTHYAGNIGAAARSMRNFGLRDLVLVEPYSKPDHPEALRLARHASDVLESARVVSSLGEAVSDCVYTLASSSLSEGPFRQTFVGPPDVQLPRLVTAMESGPTALVFGPEPHGLSNEEMTRCHGLIRIPVESDYSSMNLAQAVTVCLYELRRQVTLANPSRPSHAPRMAESPAAEPEQVLRLSASRAIASHADLERMFAHLQDALEAIHYIYGTKGGPLMHAVRHLISRAQPTPQEVKFLHGLARQMLYLSRTSEVRPANDGQSISATPSIEG